MAEKRHELVHAETFAHVLQLITAQGGGGKLAFLLLKREDAFFDSLLDGEFEDVDLASLAQPMGTVECLVLSAAESA